MRILEYMSPNIGYSNINIGNLTFRIYIRIHNQELYLVHGKYSNIFRYLIICLRILDFLNTNLGNLNFWIYSYFVKQSIFAIHWSSILFILFIVVFDICAMSQMILLPCHLNIPYQHSRWLYCGFGSTTTSCFCLLEISEFSSDTDR